MLLLPALLAAFRRGFRRGALFRLSVSFKPLWCSASVVAHSAGLPPAVGPEVPSGSPPDSGEELLQTFHTLPFSRPPSPDHSFQGLVSGALSVSVLPALGSRRGPSRRAREKLLVSPCPLYLLKSCPPPGPAAPLPSTLASGALSHKVC